MRVRTNLQVEKVMDAVRVTVLGLTTEELDKLDRDITKRHAHGEPVVRESMYLNAFVLFQAKLQKIGEEYKYRDNNNNLDNKRRRGN